MFVNRYRGEQRLIEAIQFRGKENLNECLRFIGAPDPDKPREGLQDKIILIVPSPEGYAQCTNGDYIIKSLAGNFYTQKSDVFESTYERIPQ